MNDKTVDKPQVLQFVVLAQIVGCLLVIFGHSYPFVTDVPKFLTDIRTFVYCFHMPLFIWCSGFLFVYTRQLDKRTFGQFTKVRAKRLLIPYLVLSVIGLLPKILFSEYLNDSLALEPLPIIRSFLVPRENVWGHFWFLPMIFFIGLIGYALEKVRQNLKVNKQITGWTLTAVLFALSFVRLDFGEWFGLNDVIKYTFVYVLGMTLADTYGIIEKTGRNVFIIIGILSFIFSVIIFVLIRSEGGVIADLKSKIISVLMIVSVVCLCKACETVKVSKNSLIAQTYTIFILSWPFQLIAEILLERVLGLGYYIVMPSMFIAGVVLPVLTIWLIDKIEKNYDKKIISFILGR